MTLKDFFSEIRPILPVIHNHFWFASCFSLLPPFYPDKAEQKGVPAVQYGYVFSTFKAAMLIGAISCEFAIHKLSPKTVYCCGMLGCFLFGLIVASMEWINSASVFLGVSFPLVLFGGHMVTWYMVCMYGVLTERFATKQGLLIAGFEFLWGLGNMMGVAVGGIMIDTWGFPVPFVVMGLMFILLFPVIVKRGIVKPNSETDVSNESQLNHRSDVCDEKQQEDVNYLKLLKSPLIAIDMVTVMFSWIVLGFNEPALAPYLMDQFKLDYTEVGLVFMVQFICYSLGALISGAMWYYNQTELFLFVSQFLAALSFVLVGPASFVNLEPSIPLVIASQICVGLCMSGQFVSGFAHALRTAVDVCGFPDNLKTSGVISSLTFICMVAGAIATPPIAAKLVDVYKFRKAVSIMFVPFALWSLVNLAVWLRRFFPAKKTQRRYSEKDCETKL